MADDEAPGVYSLVPAGGEPRDNSREFTGQGAATYPNGDLYEGEFVEGERTGAGKYTAKNGDVFVGFYANNKKQGKGKITYAQGGFFHGHFESGQREGEGTMKYKNGDVYSGQWKAGKRHGEGTYVFGDGSKYELAGTWIDGEIKKGRWSFQNPSSTSKEFPYFQGSFSANKPTGEGEWVYPNRRYKVTGKYTQEALPCDEAAEKGEVKIKVTVDWKTKAIAQM